MNKNKPTYTPKKPLTKEQIAEQELKEAEFVLELDKLPKQEHRWVNRGLKFTCEGANHPYHEYFPRRVSSM